jgi:PAS domain S-box-containing protein
LAGGFGQGLALIPGVTITFWPPAGIFVAALLLNPRSQWWWYVLAAGFAELVCNAIWFHNPVPFALVYVLANLFEALTAAWLLGRFATKPFRFESPADVAAFVVLATGIAPVIGATIIAITDELLGKHPFMTAWPLVWLGDATGLLVSTPIALALGQAWRRRGRTSDFRLLEAAAVAVLLVSVGALAFQNYLPTAYMTMPLVLWTAVRFRLHGAAVALALVAITSAAFTVIGSGEFAGQPNELQAKIVMLQTFLGVTAVSALLAATLSHLHQQTLLALEAAKRDLERQVEKRTAALRTSEIRYRRLFEAAHDGVLLLDPETRKIVDANPFMTSLLGSTRDELIGRELYELGFVADEQSSRSMFQALKELRQFRYENLPLRSLEGQHREVEVVANLYDEDGKPIIQCNIRDVTDRKRAEEELRRLASELSAADRRKDEFLATLAHELRNPLAPLRNGLQVMRVSSGNEEVFDEVRTMMERQLGQMVHLIDDLLDVSRISQGKLELRRKRVNLSTALNNAIETSRTLIEIGGHQLTLVVPPEPIFVDADVTRLGQVFSNLLNNAAKYSDPGGLIEVVVSEEKVASDEGRVASEKTAIAESDSLKLTTTPLATPLSPLTTNHSPLVTVSVKDTGIGIPADMLPRIFDLFTQVDRSLEKSQGGLGIGLSLVQRLVEMHGGSIEAHSEGHGKGSEFVVRLPIDLSIVETEPQTDVDREAIPSSKRRILVADDNKDAASTLAIMLRLSGNEVRTANDGLQAVEEAEAFLPHMIFLDIGMPKLNGYEACRRIRDQAWGATTVMIALTGWGQGEDKRRSQDAGFNHHFVKPIDPSALELLLADGKT